MTALAMFLLGVVVGAFLQLVWDDCSRYERIRGGYQPPEKSWADRMQEQQDPPPPRTR